LAVGAAAKHRAPAWTAFVLGAPGPGPRCVGRCL